MAILNVLDHSEYRVLRKKEYPGLQAISLLLEQA